MADIAWASVFAGSLRGDAVAESRLVFFAGSRSCRRVSVFTTAVSLVLAFGLGSLGAAWAGGVAGMIAGSGAKTVVAGGTAVFAGRGSSSKRCRFSVGGGSVWGRGGPLSGRGATSTGFSSWPRKWAVFDCCLGAGFGGTVSLWAATARCVMTVFPVSRRGSAGISPCQGDGAMAGAASACWVISANSADAGSLRYGSVGSNSAGRRGRTVAVSLLRPKLRAESWLRKSFIRPPCPGRSFAVRDSWRGCRLPASRRPRPGCGLRAKRA